MENFSLTALGWDNFFYKQLSDFILPDNFKIGRVSAENRTNYNVLAEHGEFISEVTGKLLYNAASEAELPKVGDWVIFTVMDEGKGIIHQILQRKNWLSRKMVGKSLNEQIIVANLDVLFIVQSLDSNFNISRIERYLAAVQKNIQPVVVLNKSDLCDDTDIKISEVTQRLPQVQVIATSSVTDTLQPLRSYIQEGKTFAFVGSSGVGKSTLTNKLLDTQHQRTSEVRETDSKGKHTTTRREMIVLDAGGILIDTPGMREFQPWSESSDLSQVFEDIYELAKQCKYSDCLHKDEDNCAVKEALAEGAITLKHFENYQKLQREMDYQDTLNDPVKARERKRAHKQLQKVVNKMMRNKGK